MPDHRATGKTIASSPSRNFVAVEHQLAKSLEQPQSRLMQEPKLNHGFDRHAVGVDRAVNQAFGSIDHSLETRPSMNLQPSSYVMTAGNVNMIATQHENCLFSSSLSDLFSKKLQLSSNNALYGHSVDTFASHFEEEPFESLEEIEAHTIGNLLPSDDDLFTGLTDRLDNIEQPSDGNDLEELDFFNSVGGMDLGADGSESQNDSEFPGGLSKSYLGSSNGSIAEHPYDELPSRTLFVRNINSNVEDSELKTLFEEYGDIHTLYTACKHRGFVMVSYYDIRAARNAMKALQSKPLRHRKLDIHYSIPKDNPSEKDINQGTLVVFNLDSSVSNDELHQIFGVYGEIKEIRETPHRSNHKFIQFYDVRAAEHALRELNLSDIAGKRIKLELSHLGGLRMSLLQRIPPELEKDERSSYLQQNSPPLNSTAGISGAVRHGAVISSSMENRTILGIPLSIKPPLLESEIHHGISSSVPNSLPSLLRGELFSNQTGLAEPSHSHGKLKFEFQDAPNFHPHSLPEYHDGLNSSIHYKLPHTMASNVNANLSERIDSRQFRGVGTNGHAIEFNDGFFGSAGNGSCSLPGHQYTWGGSYHPQSPGMIWPNSPSFVNDNSMVHPTTQLHGPPIAPSPTLNPITSINNHHVGSAPTGDTSLWDRRHVYAGESPETSSFFPGSLGSIRISNGSVQSMEFLSHNMFPRVVGNSMDLSIPPKNQGLQAHHPRFAMFPSRSYMFHAINSFDPPNERRSRRNEGNINQADKKQYELDIDHISRGEDNRTTLMIKNIPNKYTSKMLLAAIDEQHKGYYDFIYLPIDFKNKCNVGYAFINMVDPRHIISFYQAFNGKKWEKFNSEKVASLAYARIQGKAALIAHFQNSSLMNEDKRCRPILFNTDGPNAGDQMPFPVGVGVRTRPEKPRSITHEEKQQGNLLNSVNGEDSSSTGVGTLLQVLEKGLIKQS